MTVDAPADGKDIGQHAILMDIQGTEDHYGDMDFKVAGTTSGVTAIQARGEPSSPSSGFGVVFVCFRSFLGTGA